MEFIALIAFVTLLFLLAVISLRWGHDSRTNDDTLRIWT